jgi:polyphosphate kinase
MQRNLESRVEICTPVEAPKLRKQLRQWLDFQLANKRNVWEMQPDGSYVQRVSKGRVGTICIHRQLIKQTEKRLAEASRINMKKAMMGKKR